MGYTGRRGADRQLGWSVPIMGLLLASAVVGCSTPAGPGETQLVTAASSPASIAPPRAEVGGVIELARLRFAGSSLGTDLVGEAVSRQADGWTLVSGAAGFAFPKTVSPNDASLAVPAGPGLEGEQTLQCVTRLGAARAPSALSGINVDAGDALRFHDADNVLRLDLLRHPRHPADGGGDLVSYGALELARTPGAIVETGNWRAGATLALDIPAADPPSDRERGSIPVRTTLSEGLKLPTSFEGLSINGTAVSLPARDPTTGAVLETLPAFSLPTETQPLILTWDSTSRSEAVTVSIEYYGAGTGRCPAGCDASAECCQDDGDCSSLETCTVRSDGGMRACFPRDGSGATRLGAVVCSAQNIGSATLTADLLATLNRDVAKESVYGVVLRVGRTTSALIDVPDAMTADRTRQSISPVLVRASDVVITRLTLP